MILSIIGEEPDRVIAVGARYLRKEISDVTITYLTFPSGAQAHLFVSWLHPFKEQRMVVVGRKRMAVFDDRAPKGRKLLLFDKKVSLVNGGYVAEKPEGVTVPFDESVEPLRAECEHFLHCIKTRETPRTDGEDRFAGSPSRRIPAALSPPASMGPCDCGT